MFNEVNRTQVFSQQKCHVSYVSDMLEGDPSTCNDWRSDNENLWGHPEYYIIKEVSTREGRRSTRQLRGVTSSCARLPRVGRKGAVRDDARFTKVEKRGEIKIIRYLRMAPYQTQESREARRNWDNSMHWGDLVPVSWKKNEEEAVRWRFVSCSCVCSSVI